MPYEIWHHIFKLALEEVKIALPAHPKFRFTSCRTLLRVTHVSRRWREVALSSPDLWTRFACHNADQAFAFIERSQELPVSIFLAIGSIPGASSSDESDETRPEIPLDILTRLPHHRLRRLDLEAFLTPDTVMPLMDIHAPRLECLTISSLYDLDDDSPQDKVSLVQLLQGETEALKALALSPTVDGMPSNTFPNLTHLHIAVEPYSSAQPADIIRLLANTPRVQHLFVGALLGGEDVPIASLNALRLLVFSTCDSNLAFQVLEYLDLPSECFVRMHGILVGQEEHYELQPLPRLALFDIWILQQTTSGFSSSPMALPPVSGYRRTLRMLWARLPD
ncbi:hypothetical protein C8Q76DRAFT_297452 [Earliella scabrosa]|nr:hypothetical protein C8Q76DRAFT_297452 [Earliella scabrosa]